MCEFTLSLFENILAGFIIIGFIKLISFYKIKSFTGVYKHADEIDSELDNIEFHLTIKKSFWYFINPISNISIHIDRRGDDCDWSAILNSDILNIAHFKGNYTIKNIQGGQDGWFDAYLFKTNPNKIALHLHFINPETDRWVEDQGYFIYKNKHTKP